MDQPYCIGRCGVCPYYEACQLMNVHIVKQDGREKHERPVM